LSNDAAPGSGTGRRPAVRAADLSSRAVPSDAAPDVTAEQRADLDTAGAPSPTAEVGESDTAKRAESGRHRAAKPTDIAKLDRSKLDRGKVDRSETDKPRADEPSAVKSPTDTAPVDKARPDKPRASKSRSDRKVDRAQAEGVGTGRFGSSGRGRHGLTAIAARAGITSGTSSNGTGGAGANGAAGAGVNGTAGVNGAAGAGANGAAEAPGNGAATGLGTLTAGSGGRADPGANGTVRPGSGNSVFGDGAGGRTAGEGDDQSSTGVAAESGDTNTDRDGHGDRRRGGGSARDRADASAPTHGRFRMSDEPSDDADDGDDPDEVAGDDAVVLPFPGAAGNGIDSDTVEIPGGIDDAGESGAATFLPVVPTGRRVRARLARFNAPWQSPQVSEVLEPLIAAHRVAHPKAEIRLLQRAFDTADHWHSGQYRKSGDPYITHPLAVAGILANLGMDTTTLVAALLHDTIEDTAYGLDAMRADFGPEVALLVDGVTKLDRVKLGDAAKAETIRKMVVAMAKDPRVLVIKLADRLHNMRTLTFLPRPKQEQKAKETLEILAPLAHRLGMNTIKWELEDLAFNTLFPKKFEEIHRLIDEHAPQRDGLLRQVTNRVQTDLKGAKVKAEVTGRPKHLYSIYQKMISRSREFAEIYDLVGVRILVDSVRDCYAALGVIHANWQPVPGRFKDYIAMPKFNMYQSLHTTVIGPTGKPVEMQIRTMAMHRTAEYGIAAHWRYKETKGATVVGPPAHIDEMTWLRQLLDWQREAADPSEFLDALRFDLSSQEVYVFTPKGDVVALPSGSTPVDFAYAVHTEVGHRCIGARVNGKLVPLESTLSNGDVVEIFTSKSETAAPSQDWLGFVKSPRARTKIRQHFNKERRDEAIEAGKDAIVKAMRKQGLPLQRMLTSETLMTIARDLHLADGSALYAAVGESQVSAQSVVARLVASYGGEEGAVEDIAETAVATRPPRTRGAAYDPGVVVVGVSDVWIKLARCCTPVPGDAVFGFVTRSGGVSVHREDCVNAPDLLVQEERLVEVTWKATSASTFLVAIQVEALDRHKLLADVTKALSEERVNILSATVTTTRDRVAVSRFSFEMADPKHLGHLLAAVRRVDGVYDAYRVTSGA
jgi:GTP diphosphokinase / guanosine-3',5'-bis(diphosphate) 3'-diphosphatase